MAVHFRDKLYQFISDFLSRTGVSPSFGEMTAAMQISPRSKSLITRNLRALAKEGKVILEKDGRRLLITLPRKHLPLLGRISAGAPIEAIADEQSIDLNTLLLGEGRFALQVKGQSMIEEGIWDGDLIICREANTAKEGEIVVALIDQQQTTLKKISYQSKNAITLIPANAALKPQIYGPDRVMIQGVYLGLIRVNR